MALGATQLTKYPEVDGSKPTGVNYFDFLKKVKCVPMTPYEQGTFIAVYFGTFWHSIHLMPIENDTSHVTSC